MKRIIIILSAYYLLTSQVVAQFNTVSSDKDWSSQQAAITNAYEAEIIIRIGDVDNLGFGWPENFDPFCGRMTDAHEYPWEVNASDLPGMDRILLSSKYNPASPGGCGQDGYSGSFNPKTSKPVTYSIPTTAAKGTSVQNAWIQLFIDDFQAPTFCSHFRVQINGARFAEGEKMLNATDQTGPVGKLISMPVPEEYYEDIAAGKPFTIYIDEINGAGDGFAIDFIRLLVNRKRDNSCKGNITGYVLDKETNQPIRGAMVVTSEKKTAGTNAEGRFELLDIPTGYEVISATASGYTDGSGLADVGEGSDNSEVWIFLEIGKKSIVFDNQDVQAGEIINLRNILFDQGKADLRPQSIAELEKIVTLMQANPSAEIELSGHTSSEGNDAVNRSLSYKRVKACKDFVVAKGIDPGRIIAIGYGPDRPVASNDTEVNRAKNRRVEMRIIKL